MAASPLGPRDAARYIENYKAEVDGVTLYRLMAEAEKNDAIRAVYERLCAVEARHLALWRTRLEQMGVAVPPEAPSRRVRMLGWLARRFGPSTIAPIVARMESAATTMYDDQPEAVEHGLPADERSHARVFNQIARAGDAEAGAGAIARIEGRHRFASSGNALRAAVLGVNDGLVSTLSLVMGVAGADPGRSFVLLAGLGGLLAGAFSMALGEWISVRSSAESFQKQLEIERTELELDPEEELEELILIYQAKGIPEGQARQAASRIMANKETALDTLAREELGMSESETANAWTAAGTSMLLFAIGAILPVLPWFFVGGWTAIVASAIAAGAGLFLAGAATSLFTGRNFAFSGGRMLVIGMTGAAITFGVGRLIGVQTGG